MNLSHHLTVPLRRSEKIWGWIYLPVYLVLLGEFLVAGAEYLGMDVTTDHSLAVINGAYFLINFFFTLLIFRRFLWQNLLQVKKRFWGFVQAVILGLVMYYVGAMLVGIFISVVSSPNLSNPNDQNITKMAQAAQWIMVPGTVILAPFAEECLMRGLLFRGMYDRSRILAFILSVLVFAVIHVKGYVDSVPLSQLALNFLQYLPSGIALAWAYEKADSIFAPIVMHCLINSIATWVKA